MASVPTPSNIQIVPPSLRGCKMYLHTFDNTTPTPVERWYTVGLVKGTIKFVQGLDTPSPAEGFGLTYANTQTKRTEGTLTFTADLGALGSDGNFDPSVNPGGTNTIRQIIQGISLAPGSDTLHTRWLGMGQALSSMLGGTYTFDLWMVYPGVIGQTNPYQQVWFPRCFLEKPADFEISDAKPNMISVSLKVLGIINEDLTDTETDPGILAGQFQSAWSANNFPEGSHA